LGSTATVIVTVVGDGGPPVPRIPSQIITGAARSSSLLGASRGTLVIGAPRDTES
jgi:hypothetical protein